MNAIGTQIIVERRDGRGRAAIPGVIGGVIGGVTAGVTAGAAGAGEAATANPHFGQNCDPGGNAVLQFQQSSAIPYRRRQNPFLLRHRLRQQRLFSTR
jgi:hypothetical protein